MHLLPPLRGHRCRIPPPHIAPLLQTRRSKALQPTPDLKHLQSFRGTWRFSLVSAAFSAYPGQSPTGPRGSYGKAKLLQLVLTVVMERTPELATGVVWENCYHLPPLPSVSNIVIQPVDRHARQDGGEDTTLTRNTIIEWLCPSATRFHVSLPYGPVGVESIRPLPSLPRFRALLLKVVLCKLDPRGGLFIKGQIVSPPWCSQSGPNLLLSCSSSQVNSELSSNLFLGGLSVFLFSFSSRYPAFYIYDHRLASPHAIEYSAQAATLHLVTAATPRRPLDVPEDPRMRIRRSPRRAAAARVANTADIVEHILDHPFASKDLASFLRVSPLFFHIAGRKLYSTLPISNALNPFSSSSHGGERWGGRGPYGKGQFFPYIRTVVVEKAPIPNRPTWAGWEELAPLPSVENVIYKRGPTSKLCCSATRLYLSTPRYASSEDSLQRVPFLPNVHTLVLKGRAADIENHDLVAVEQEHDAVSAWCSNIREVHLLLWGDVEYPYGPLDHIGGPSRSGVTYHQLMMLFGASSVHLSAFFYGRLRYSIRDLASLENVEVLHLYNVEEILKRIANCNPSGWRVGVGTAEEMLTGVKESFIRKEEDASQDEASEDEANEEEASEERVSLEGASEEGASGKEKKSLSVTFHPGAAFYKTFGSYGHSQKEAWYRSLVLEPSAKLVALRQELADMTGEPADYFSGLSEKNVETILDTYEG
ncbi:hypothetical protein L198_00025 [Cryptococcus wingfieldii CBS 7118]|uniref:Uncharacterized protein n=1 Tax=Cryptococcus wingfieldii CBS 7118 TaxID=1295528 RepID=A0A1E3K7U6_9TREE|nr:hypothetical protein L198_00025 [Cryptococcus wingfieldii CBS 7118]ODO08302.1 hypothetical protein L198_00025 [Cryptococcus wingfieldii CBS 7118]